MNKETLEAIVMEQEEYVDKAKSYDPFLDTAEKEKSYQNMDKAQQLEHAERKMKIEESKQKLEYDKFEYQKKQNKKDNVVKIVCAGFAALGATIAGTAKIIQVVMQRKYVREAYSDDRIEVLSSKVARTLASDGANPKI